MYMSKHHTNALIFIGIAVCAGFLLSVPAVAGSGQGLTALESGELFQIPFGGTPAAEDGAEPSGIPALPDEEDASDAFPTPDNAGVPDLLVGADTEPAMSAAPDDTNSPPLAPVPVVDAAPGGTDSYDDERLAELINTASIRLMRLSMEHAHALYLQDWDAASIAADDLHAFSIRLLGEVQPLQVSPVQQPVKDEFIRSLSAYSTASEMLLGSTDAGGDAVPTAFRDLAIASEGLEAVGQQAVEVQPARTATTPAAEAPAVFAGTGPVLVAPPAETLPLGERYTYDDPSGENMASLLAESTRTVTAYKAASTNESEVKTEAGEGRMFLLVVIKGTNLGHKGDSDLYAVETPGRDAFVLECQGTTFEPLEVPAFTSLGESFDRKTLDRYESLKGYLYFDVPATLEVSGATIRADLGNAGTPAWDFGRELGKEPGNPDAV
jgi:hypothetical protein